MAQATPPKKEAKGRASQAPLSKLSTSKKAPPRAVDECTTEEKAPKAQPQPRRPSRPKTLHPLESLLGETLITARGDVVSPKTFAKEDGVVGLYFAAHWCPPCRSFCPSLMLLYDELRKRGVPFEVVYISLDNKESSFNDYLAKMPWHAIAFDEEEKREEIAVTFGIKGIPVLVLLDAKTLEVIAFNGREIVSRDPRGVLFPWKYLSDDQGSSVDSHESPPPPVEPQHVPSQEASEPGRKRGSEKRRSSVGLSARQSLKKESSMSREDTTTARKKESALSSGRDA